MNLPTIAIVIPAKNEAQYLGRCLESLRLLEYPKELTEIYVVDNGSSDSTLEIAGRFPEVSVSSHLGNIGALRNIGAKQSTSELIAFLDADCVPPPDWLKISTRHLRDGVAVVGASISLAEENCTWVERCWIEYLNTKHSSDITEVRTITSFCFVVARETMEKVGWFNEQLKTCEDSDLGYRISQGKGKLLVDKSIRTEHLRNAKTPSVYFRRQVWQGGSNLRNLLAHRLELSELPSLLAPALYIGLLIALPIALLRGQPVLAIWVASAVIGIPLLLAIVKRKNGKPSSILSFSIIWFLYLTARGVALFRTMWHPRHWR